MPDEIEIGKGSKKAQWHKAQVNNGRIKKLPLSLYAFEPLCH